MLLLTCSPSLKVVLPTFRQGFGLSDSLQHVRVHLLARVQANDLGNRDSILVLVDLLYGIPGCHFPLSEHPKIESTEPAGQEAFDHIVPPEFEAQFVIASLPI